VMSSVFESVIVYCKVIASPEAQTPSGRSNPLRGRCLQLEREDCFVAPLLAM